MKRVSDVRQDSSRTWFWLLLLSLLYAAFFVLRYGGLWIENDTGVFSNQAVLFIHSGTVFYHNPYPHGYAYTAWLGSLSLLTGIDPNTVNTILMPFFGIVLLTIPGYLAYREMLQSDRIAAMAVIVLLAIPDITFSALRGTHEKLSMGFVTMGLFCLIKGLESLTLEKPRRDTRLWLGTYVVVAFLNAGTNDYFASTFTFALTITVAAGLLLLRLRRVDTPGVRSAIPAMIITVLLSWMVVMGSIFVVYPPARQDFLLLKGAVNKLSHLFATMRPSSNPYTAASSQWASQGAYQAMNLFRWFVVLCSAGMWVVDGYRVAFKRQTLKTGRLFLLSMYTAFAALVVVSIPVDFSGLAAGSNLEVRNFTYVILLGTPLVAQVVYRFVHARAAFSIRTWRIYLHPVLRLGVVGVMSLMLLVGFLKVTLDPFVSNNWLYYTASERQTLRFFWTHNRRQYLWTGPDDRLAFYAHAQLVMSNPGQNTILGYTITPFTAQYLRSPVVIASARALHFALPDYGRNDRVYDNGDSQIYFRRPASPFMQ